MGEARNSVLKAKIDTKLDTKFDNLLRTTSWTPDSGVLGQRGEGGGARAGGTWGGAEKRCDDVSKFW